MRKHYLFLIIYFLVMGAGLFICRQFLRTPYDSPHFGQTFLPFTLLLACMVVIYGLRYRTSLKMQQPDRATYLYGLLPLFPLAVLAVIAAVTDFSWSVVFLIPLIDALLVSIAEEGLFRGIILGGTAKHIKPLYALLLSSLLFSALHLLNLLGGLAPAEVASQLLSTFVMGLFLGAVYLYTRNLYLPIIFHFVWDYIFLADGLSAVSFAPLFFIVTIILEIIIICLLLYKMRHWQAGQPTHT